MKIDKIQETLKEALDYWKPARKKKFIVKVAYSEPNPGVPKEKTIIGKYGNLWEIIGVEFTEKYFKLKALDNKKVTTKDTVRWNPKFSEIESIQIKEIVDMGTKE